MAEQQDDGNPGGRPTVLSDDKRRTILAMLANGSSRRMATRYVGCGFATFARALESDPGFATDVLRAEQRTEIEALRRIVDASRKPRYWRAAAWLLERRNHRDFGQRTPRAYTDEEIAAMFGQVVTPVVENLSDDEYFAVLDRLDRFLDQSRGEQDPSASMLPPPPPT
ncbi:MAG: hypothetical protein ABFC96_18875, partial [Thermoguttaceae bacterium]